MRMTYLHVVLGFSSLIVVLPLLFFMPGCAPAPNYWEDAKPGQKKILVTFPPLYSMAHAVAGDDGYVLCMLTTNGPHDYQGAATDLFMINKADILFFNGLTLDDHFVDKMERSHKNRDLVSVNLGKALLDLKLPRLILEGDGKWHDHGDGKKHKHGKHDPHLWLGPRQAIEMTKIIRDKLAEVDPTHKKGYEERAAKYIARLAELEAHGKDAFKLKKNKKFITQHEAFAYFAHAFGVEIVKSIQMRPGMDSDPVRMGELLTLCKAEGGPRVIAVEPQYSSNQAEAIQAALERQNVQVTIVTLDPLETADIAKDRKLNPDPDHYLKKMRENIDTLAKALP